MRRASRANAGFTFVEILATLSITALLFVPMMQLFSHAMEGTQTSRDLITAVSLARWEMERTKNLGNKPQRLKIDGNVTWPPEGQPAFPLNGRAWRLYRILEAESEPLQVTVEARREGEEKPLARLTTLLGETVWVPKTQGVQ